MSNDNNGQGKSFIVNPYAKIVKKKKDLDKTKGATKVKENILDRAHDNNNNNNNNNNKIVRINNDIGPFSSFSQAFNVDSNDEHSQEEETVTQGNLKQFEGTHHATSLSNVKTTTGSLSSELLSSNATDPRENHALLQPHMLYVSTRQRGNGILKYIRNVPFSFSKIVPDYIISSNRCALFLSCKYHVLHPTYIQRRLDELKTDFDSRILLCLVDLEDNTTSLFYLNKFTVVNKMSLVLAWSEQEAARYLETFKVFEGKDASSIQKRGEQNFTDQMANLLSSVRSVNKTDSAHLLSQFGSLKALVSAPMDELSLCPGIGEKKVRINEYMLLYKVIFTYVVFY